MPPVSEMANSDMATPRAARKAPTKGSCFLLVGSTCMRTVYAATATEAVIVAADISPVRLTSPSTARPTPSTRAVHCRTDSIHSNLVSHEVRTRQGYSRDVVKPSVPNGPPHIVLGGGIGSGKSLVAALLDAAGAAVISADEVGHGVLEPDGAAFAEVAARWPSIVVKGRIDRPRLAGIVFRDPAELAALEALTHPAIIETILDRVTNIDRPVIVEVPLILDLGDGWRRVYVDADHEVRIERAVARGADEGDVRRRATAQPDREEWLLWADDVIVNEGTKEELATQVDALWLQVTSNE